MKSTHTLAILLASLVLALPACDDEEISQNTAPNVSGQTIQPAASTAASAAAQPQRLLGAIIPYNGATWFYKLTGPAQAVSELDIPFEQFVATTTFNGNAPTQQLPDGWSVTPSSSQMRYADVNINNTDPAVELTITTFPGDVGGLLQNVNRWRGQVGLQPVNEQGLQQIIKPVELQGGLTATVVDFTGSGGSNSMTGQMPPMLSGTAPATQQTAAAPQAPVTGAPQTVGPITFTAPAEWQAGRPSSMRIASFAATNEAGQSADISIIPLGPQSGTKLENINRWRTQVGLPPITEQQLATESQTLNIGGIEGYYVNLNGSETTGQSILAAAVEHAGAIVFIKLTGPSPIVATETQNFQSFLDSIKFNEPGAN